MQINLNIHIIEENPIVYKKRGRKASTRRGKARQMRELEGLIDNLSR